MEEGGRGCGGALPVGLRGPGSGSGAENDKTMMRSSFCLMGPGV